MRTVAPLELDEPLAVAAVPELLQAAAVNATAHMATNTVIRVPRTFILTPRDEAIGLECGAEEDHLCRSFRERNLYCVAIQDLYI
jgi:hypothetical protein